MNVTISYFGIILLVLGVNLVHSGTNLDAAGEEMWHKVESFLGDTSTSNDTTPLTTATTEETSQPTTETTATTEETSPPTTETTAEESKPVTSTTHPAVAISTTKTTTTTTTTKYSETEQKLRIYQLTTIVFGSVTLILICSLIATVLMYNRMQKLRKKLMRRIDEMRELNNFSGNNNVAFPKASLNEIGDYHSIHKK